MVRSDNAQWSALLFFGGHYLEVGLIETELWAGSKTLEIQHTQSKSITAETFIVEIFMGQMLHWSYVSFKL